MSINIFRFTNRARLRPWRLAGLQHPIPGIYPLVLHLFYVEPGRGDGFDLGESFLWGIRFSAWRRGFMPAELQREAFMDAQVAASTSLRREALVSYAVCRLPSAQWTIGSPGVGAWK